MSAAVFRTMLLGLIRDRAALAMSFVLPAVFFLVGGLLMFLYKIDRHTLSRIEAELHERRGTG